MSFTFKPSVAMCRNFSCMLADCNLNSESKLGSGTSVHVFSVNLPKLEDPC